MKKGINAKIDANTKGITTIEKKMEKSTKAIEKSEKSTKSLLATVQKLSTQLNQN